MDATTLRPSLHTWYIARNVNCIVKISSKSLSKECCHRLAWDGWGMPVVASYQYHTPFCQVIISYGKWRNYHERVNCIRRVLSLVDCSRNCRSDDTNWAEEMLQYALARLERMKTFVCERFTSEKNGFNRRKMTNTLVQEVYDFESNLKQKILQSY